MRLAEGFVVGGRYRIKRLLAAGSKFRAYQAEGGASGPGQVCVKVARHEEVQSLGGLHAGRARVEAEWEALVRLHERATSAAPMPIELVRMYPGEPAVRKVALLDKAVVAREPYLVSELADGVTLASLLRGELLDEERALLIALRVTLFVRAAREVGVEVEDFSPSNFVVDRAGENLTVVGLTGRAEPVPTHRGGDAMPTGFGRLLAGLLGGVAAPEWGAEPDDRPRWERLLENRRVPPEFHGLILGTLGFGDEFPPGLDAVENRIRALVGAPKPPVHDHPARSRDAPYLIAPGERIADRFEVIAPLGQGGRGFVYRARDRLSGAEVLFKCNKYAYDSGSAFALELATRRMELEHEYGVLKQFAARTGMLPQPVALAHGRGRGSWFDLAPDLAVGEPFLVMELVKGIPLLEMLPHPLQGYQGAADPRNRLPPRFVLRLVTQIADLLAEFHAAGYLYQDLKPENVLYDPRAENVFMVDFAGACPRLPDGTLDKSHVAFGVQTHGFAAPEFAERWERSDERFDIYSLGATAYHLLNGINPERVAVEEATEYPTLALRPLETLPPPIAELVARCLAPHDERLPTAAAVKRMAEAARLQLSRSRPLDVREPAVSYTTEGVELRWTLPDDPRVNSVRVRCLDDDDGPDEDVYVGPPVERVVDETPVAADRRYVIQTAYTRAGRMKHSRGRVAESEAYPPVVRFDVAPYFGGNKVRCELAPHARDVAIRWSAETPPMDATSGEPLDARAGLAVLHFVEPGVTAHYAAFALYEDDVVSVPRFGTATALGALPDPGALVALQTDDAVRLEWERPDDALVVLAAAGRDEPRRLVPERDATTLLDSSVAPGTVVEYRLVAEDDGVTSDILASCTVRRWPALPEVTFTAGPGRVTVDAEGPTDERIIGFEVSVAPAGGAPADHVDIGGVPATIDLAPGVETDITVRAVLDDPTGGPSATGRVVVPPVDVELTVDDHAARLPIGLVLEPPEGADSWTGVYRLEVIRDGQTLDEAEGAISELFAGPSGRLARELGDASVHAADEVEYAVRLFAPDGALAGETVHPLRGVERLDPPACSARLAAVVVEAIDGVDRADLRIIRAGDESELHGVRLPQLLDLREGERVEVRVRRSVEGEPMLWSSPTDIEALARPNTPTSGRTAVAPAGVEVAWEDDPQPGTDYVVRDADGRLVYVGVQRTFTDLTGGARAYSVAARRNGLESARLEVVAEGGSAGRSSGSLVTVPPARRVRGLLPGHDRLVQCIRIGRTNVIELVGAARPRLIVVLRGGDERDLDEAVGRLHGPDWLSTPGVAAAHIVTSRRALVPWRGGGGPVRIVEAALEVQRPDWRIVVPSVEPVRGAFVGAIGGENEVVLWSPSRPIAVGDSDALLVYPAGDVAKRLRLTAPDGTAVHLIDDGGVPVALGDAGAAAVGVGVELSDGPAVLVPAPSFDLGDELDLFAWADVARGFPLFVAQRLEAEWRAPVASLSLGAASTFHYLREGAHVALTAGCELVSARGRARLHVEVASEAGRFAMSASVSLARPASYARLVRRTAEWIDRRITDESGPADPIALIA